MNFFRYILAVALGWISGAALNYALIQVGHHFYPMDGVDLNDMDQLAEAMPLLDWQFFIFPFLAHALGTLLGAFVAGLIAPSKKMVFALVIGVFFLLAGIMVNLMLPGPMWFAALDILIAYIPMAWIGGKIALKLSSKP
jgi:hypothetical protein